MRCFETVVVDTDYIGGESFFTSEIDMIKSLGGTVRFENYSTEEEIIAGCKNAEIVICCGNPAMNENVLSQIPGKLIIRNGIGVNSVDTEAATRYGKIVCNTPGYCTEELAMHGTGLVLACLRNIGFYNNAVKKGQWPKGEGPSPRRLSKLTVGLLGFGASARRIGEIFFDGFKSRVIAFDPYVDSEVIENEGVKSVDFETLLSESDILSVHVPLNDQTEHMINRSVFKKMKSEAILINIARGGIVDENALIEALQKGEIRGAGLDVLETEPIEENNPLLAMDQVVLTPHSAFYGIDADENSHVIVAELIKGYIEKALPRRNVVNRNVINQMEGFRLV